MRLHVFIETHREAIIETWVDFAKTCVPAADAMGEGALRDHAVEMLDAIVDDMRSDQTDEQQRLKSLGQRDARLVFDTDGEAGTPAQAHGAGRAQSGFSIVQVVSEYRVLRASVLRLWLAVTTVSEEHRSTDLVRFNETIDQAIAESVARFDGILETTRRDVLDQLEARVAERTRQLAEANERLLAQIRMREQSEAARGRILRQLVTAQEDEQRRIGRELHDHLGQQVTAVGLRVRALRGLDGLLPSVVQELDRIEAMMRQLDDEVDVLVWRLRPPALDDLGLDEAIGDFVHNWSQNTGVSAQIQVQGSGDGRFSPEVETVLFRVTQEALNNVAKHANATDVNVVLRHEPQETVLSIADNGAGFDADRQRLETTKHFGLRGMRERADMVGGRFIVDTRPGRGTTITVRVPPP